MTLQTFISLSSDTYKVLSYFYITIYENWGFNIRIIERYLKISDEAFFKTLYLLKISGIISFQIDKENSRVFLSLGQSPVNLNIENWPINLITLFNTIVFQNERKQLYDLINYVYRNLDKYDEDTMSEFFDSSIEDKKIIIDTDKLKSDSRKLRKLSRKLQDDKAKVIFNYFYDVYKKSYFIRITETLKSEELKEAKELCSQYPSFSSEFFI